MNVAHRVKTAGVVATDLHELPQSDLVREPNRQRILCAGRLSKIELDQCGEGAWCGECKADHTAGPAMKAFKIEPGFRARIGERWFVYGSSLLIADEDEVDVFIESSIPAPGNCVGHYRGSELNPDRPPFGLRRARQI